jgi:hypothetical protein
LLRIEPVVGNAAAVDIADIIRSGTISYNGTNMIERRKNG